MTSGLIIRHFGPDPTTVGGIATVIRVLTECGVGGDVIDFSPTWTPHAPVTTLRLVAGAVRALMQMPATQIAHVHLSERGSFLREGALVGLARRRSLVTAVTIHGASFIPFAEKHPWLVSRVLRLANLVTCLDPAVLDFVRANAPNVTAEILPNPVVVDKHLHPADRTSELVLFAGEIGRRKGADVLYRAWRIVAQRRPEAQCLMVGPVADFMPPRAPRLEVRPPVDPREMRRLFERARVVALPARAEGMPMVLTEAMSLGRPFVSTAVGGIPELAEAGGILVPVDDEISLANHITDLLANPNLAQMIGERGRHFCVETRSVEVIDARLRKLYSTATCR